MPTIVICLDISGSMRPQFNALLQALKDISKLLQMTPAIQIRIVLFSDYCDSLIREISPLDCDLIQYLSSKSMQGGGDHPEAQKSAVALALQQEDIDAIFMITDAPPHEANSNSANAVKEREWLKRQQMPIEWDELIARAKQRNIAFFSLLFNDRYMHYTTAADETRGTCLLSQSIADSIIRQQILAMLFSMVGFSSPVPSVKSKQVDIQPIVNLTKDDLKITENNLDDALAILYSLIVSGSILMILDNAAFSCVWSSVCAFRISRPQDICDLISRFGEAVSKLTGNDKKRAQEWCEQAYNNANEIVDIVVAHAEASEQSEFAVVMASAPMTLSPRDFLAIFRDCQSKMYSEAQTAMSSLKIITLSREEVLKNAETVVPLDIDKFHGLLSSTLCPGAIMKSMRLIGVFYMLLLRTVRDEILVEKARSFLEKHSILTATDSLSYSYGMCQLVLEYSQYFSELEVSNAKKIIAVSEFFTRVNHTKLPEYTVICGRERVPVQLPTMSCETCGMDFPHLFMQSHDQCVACFHNFASEYCSPDGSYFISSCSNCGDYYCRMTSVSAPTPLCTYCRYPEEYSREHCRVKCTQCSSTCVYPYLKDSIVLPQCGFCPITRVTSQKTMPQVPLPLLKRMVGLDCPYTMRPTFWENTLKQDILDTITLREGENVLDEYLSSVKVEMVNMNSLYEAFTSYMSNFVKDDISNFD